jgi:CMP-N,N'-diacetyllegionaminic acid synthase
MRVLGVVTARGGSKGVPGKNIRPLAGKPLIVWTIEAARGAKSISRLILSTDDVEIAAVGREAGIEVPFMRPVELATDAAPTLPVLQHAVAQLEESGDRFDAILLLQPTNPFRTAALIEGAIARFSDANADSLISVLPIPAEYNPHWAYLRDASGLLHLATGERAPIPRRQDLPPAFHREGSIYLVRRDVLMQQNSLYGNTVVGYEVDAQNCVNIDTLEDWARAEAVLAARSTH